TQLGTGGNDKLIGGPSQDALFGGAGRDLLRGGRGLADTLVGGPGADKLVGVKAVDVVAFDPLDTFSMAADPGLDPMAISAAPLADHRVHQSDDHSRARSEFRSEYCEPGRAVPRTRIRRPGRSRRAFPARHRQYTASRSLRHRAHEPR